MSAFSVNQSNIRELVVKLFNDGFSNREIKESLHLHFGIEISERHLKRKLQELGLRRNKNYNVNNIVAAVEVELNGSGRCLGYRSMASRLRNRYGLRAPRAFVADVLRELDEEGVNCRANGTLRRRTYSNKGPNYLIHVDGYDKLKPFGFPIHGAIDGFSRRILWLRVYSTNNNPKVIGSYFVDFPENLQGLPRCIRVDAGTENVLLVEIQRAFRQDHEDDMAGYLSVLIGKSTSNQRIERWWRTLRDSVVQFWMNYFKDMADIGIYSNADPVHVECLRYCFYDLIDSDLTDFVREWNSHSIRCQRNVDTPHGKPDLLYFTPESYGAEDYKTPVDADVVRQIREEFCVEPSNVRGCMADFTEMCDQLMSQNGLSRPANASEALDLYRWLLRQF